MRRSSVSLVPPGMYRHFAAVTLALATALAMFADGENRQAEASPLVEAKPTEREAPASFDRPATSRSGAANSGWNDEPDFDPSFGQPMERPQGTGANKEATAEDEEVSGDPPDAFAPPTMAERERLLRQLREDRSRAPTLAS